MPGTPKRIVRVLEEQVVVKEAPGPQFFGTVREWDETLLEVITDAANQLEKKHGRRPTILEVSPGILTILEHTVAYRQNYKVDSAGELLDLGKDVGTLNNRFKVVKSFDLPLNTAKIILVAGDPERRIDEWEIYAQDMPNTGEVLEKLSLNLIRAKDNSTLRYLVYSNFRLW